MTNYFIYALFVAAILFPANLYAEEIAVIVNEAGPLTQISEADVREIYLGNIKFLGGAAIAPIHYSEGPVKDAFLASIVKMNSREYRLYWTKKVFQEGAPVPAVQNNFPLILLFVSKNKGAIGYTLRSEFADMKGIKIVATVNR
ncbi:MAG: hypothetical protein HY026_05770 [Deltaproteobacteria bacterium]|nr:hypothetical protein [Deltaproteobacteria bacterium]